jgi:hypothetical protein
MPRDNYTELWRLRELDRASDMVMTTGTFGEPRVTMFIPPVQKRGERIMSSGIDTWWGSGQGMICYTHQRAGYCDPCRGIRAARAMQDIIEDLNKL